MTLVQAPKNLIFVRELAQLDQYAAVWDRLAARASRFFPSYRDCRSELEGQRFLAVIEVKDGRTAEGIACFLNRVTRQDFTVGERRLFSLPAVEAALLGEDILGDFSDASLAHLLRAATQEWRIDLFTLGEVATGSSLCNLSAKPSPAMVRTRRKRQEPIRWLITLPASIDEYLRQLRYSTRKSISYTIRRFEREVDFRFEIVTRPVQVERFLRDAEQINRQTYQWNVGQRLVDDEDTRLHFSLLAERQRLRCYILYIGGEPCAFARGEVGERAYHYGMVGFLPKFQRYSPGLVLLMWIIRDLIENTSCEIFDFGSGGDSEGYKSRFGTLAVPCTDLQFAFLWRPHSLLLFSLHAVLFNFKKAANAIIGRGALRRRLKKAIRSYSPATATGGE